jgi:hypothetical protein
LTLVWPVEGSYFQLMAVFALWSLSASICYHFTPWLNLKALRMDIWNMTNPADCVIDPTCIRGHLFMQKFITITEHCDQRSWLSGETIRIWITDLQRKNRWIFGSKLLSESIPCFPYPETRFRYNFAYKWHRIHLEKIIPQLTLDLLSVTQEKDDHQR